MDKCNINLDMEIEDVDVGPGGRVGVVVTELTGEKEKSEGLMETRDSSAGLVRRLNRAQKGKEILQPQLGRLKKSRPDWARFSGNLMQKGRGPFGRRGSPVVEGSWASPVACWRKKALKPRALNFFVRGLGMGRGPCRGLKMLNVGGRQVQRQDRRTPSLQRMRVCSWKPLGTLLRRLFLVLFQGGRPLLLLFFLGWTGPLVAVEENHADLAVLGGDARELAVNPLRVVEVVEKIDGKRAPRAFEGRDSRAELSEE